MAVAATAGSAAFIAWDANDRKGGVGVTRAVTATATAALIVADYKLCLAGLKNSPNFSAPGIKSTSGPPPGSCACASATGGCTPRPASSSVRRAASPAPYQRHLSKLQDSARPLECSMFANGGEWALAPSGGTPRELRRGERRARRPGSRRHGVVRRGRGERGETGAGATNRPVLAGGVAGRRRLAGRSRAHRGGRRSAQVHRAVTSAPARRWR